MSAITPERYYEFGKTSYINCSYIPEAFCVESVGQYSSSPAMIDSEYGTSIKGRVQHREY